MARQERWFIIAHVSTPDGEKHAIHCKRVPPPQEINLLYILCEHVNRIINVDDVCHRMKISNNAMRILMCRLRKKLHYDWIISPITNKGVRLVFIGGAYSEADRTYITIRPNLQSVKRRHRVYSQV